VINDIETSEMFDNGAEGEEYKNSKKVYLTEPFKIY
jgi:hypothetical protein